MEAGIKIRSSTEERLDFYLVGGWCQLKQERCLDLVGKNGLEFTRQQSYSGQKRGSGVPRIRMCEFMVMKETVSNSVLLKSSKH